MLVYRELTKSVVRTTFSGNCVFSVLCMESRKLNCCSHGVLSDLIGESAGTWLSAMFDKMAAIDLRIRYYLRHGRVLKITVKLKYPFLSPSALSVKTLSPFFSHSFLNLTLA